MYCLYLYLSDLVSAGMYLSHAPIRVSIGLLSNILHSILSIEFEYAAHCLMVGGM